MMFHFFCILVARIALSIFLVLFLSLLLEEKIDLPIIIAFGGTSVKESIVHLARSASDLDSGSFNFSNNISCRSPFVINSAMKLLSFFASRFSRNMF